MDFEIAKELIAILGQATDGALYGVVMYFVYKVLGLGVLAGAAYGVYRTVNYAMERHAFSFRICRVLGHDWIPSNEYSRDREKVLSDLYKMKKLCDDYKAAEKERKDKESTGKPGSIIDV